MRMGAAFDIGYTGQMTDTTEQQEPTMEEILSSIRRIINEEGDEESDSVTADTNADEIPVFKPAAEPEPKPKPEPKAESKPVADNEILELTEFADDPQEDGGESTPPDAIISDEAVGRTHQSFTELSALMVAGYEGADNTLEGLVRELLKPMLKAYLDENLPRIAEEMVAKEIARISRSG
jgi:cell pole-organizing protein PopZ